MFTMFTLRLCRAPAIAALPIVASVSVWPAAAQLPGYGIGRAPSAGEVAAWDLTIPFDGEGLPAGSGTAVLGRTVYVERCDSCHGDKGQDPKYGMLAGGQGSLASAKPLRTVGSFWPYAPVLWSYIRRAQPLDEPGSLSADQVYAVTAYLLYLNGIIGEHDIMDANTLPQVRMPNRDGFVPDPRPDVTAIAE